MAVSGIAANDASRVEVGIEKHASIAGEAVKGKMSSGERSRQRRLAERARRQGANTPTGGHADEALRSLVRILAREAARELFERSCVSPNTKNTAEDGRP